MNFIAIVVALALEQWRAFQWRAGVERAFVRLARYLERAMNGGTRQQGAIATLLALAPPVVITALIHFALVAVHPLLALLWSIAVLYLLMGFRRFSHAVSSIVLALKAGELPSARRTLAAWRGGVTAELSSEEIARLAIERGLIDAYRQVFAVMFWFVILPGPAGAVLYRAAVLLADEWKAPGKNDDTTPIGRERATFGQPARQVLAWLDWIPVRLTALSFAIVGDFEDAVACWRTQAQLWANEDGGVPIGILLASGGGALGVKLGGPLATIGGERDYRPEVGMGDSVDPDVLPSGVGLVWRTLVLWLLLILLLTLAYVAP
ncbi:MAG TPA: CobD/CbiB family protein [Casimicrobiaceae bacterium]